MQAITKNKKRKLNKNVNKTDEEEDNDEEEEEEDDDDDALIVRKKPRISTDAF
jgi:hypothetical protein